MEVESTIVHENPTQTQTQTRKKDDNGICYLHIFIFLLFIFPPLLYHQVTDQNPSNPPIFDPNSTAKIACSSTLYPSLCFTTLSPATNNTTQHLLRHSINETIKLVSITRHEIIDFFAQYDLNSQEINALNDCIDMLDQTLYELTQTMLNLGVTPIPFSNVKTLLSGAMTNEHTCIDGFSDLEQLGPDFDTHKGFRHLLDSKLSPIVHMISNSLAIVKQTEGLSSKSRSKHGVFPWRMTRKERRLMGKRSFLIIRPNVVVAWDGSGDYRTVNEAVNMAPNMSERRYVIKIKRGVYKENVEIPRNKENIMLMGDGMNYTLITGNRSLVDGFSTFTSATLTVIGNRFLARDLTIENTASIEKHQAVALRVTANAAFYRCNFTSYQDTLYVHSLRQLFRDCVIQGTIDFIFGNSAAIFQNCHILARKPIPGQSNMVTAQSRDDPNQNTGFSFQNCTIKAAPDLDFSYVDRRRFLTFLGRPWRNYSRTIIMKSYMGDLIHPRGWSAWDRYSNLDTIEYIEYMNFGPGSITKYRVRWGGYKKNYTEELASRFTVGAFLNGSDDWFETIGFPFYRSS